MDRLRRGARIARRHGFCGVPALLLAVACSLSTATTSAAAAGRPEKNPWDLKMFRFEFDNDSFVGSDDAFSAGWSFQLHSQLRDQWDPVYASWIGKFPGLGDDGAGRRITRWAYGINQVIITPNDITIEQPQPADAPWAGILGASGSWAAYDNRRLAAAQIFLGCMGPCAQAQGVQTFIHDNLGFGEHPAGWGNQLSNRALANGNYEYRYKLLTDEVGHYLPGRFAYDIGVGGQAAVGNLNTSLSVQAELRFGWGMPMGFTKIPDPPGLGMVVEPVYFDPTQPLTHLKGWRTYFNLVGRRTWFDYFAPAEGGPTESGYNHPALRPYPLETAAIFGLHLVRAPVGFHLTYYSYFGGPDRASSSDWVNFSFEYRF
jgi:lipid A 3-O-deacylase